MRKITYKSALYILLGTVTGSVAAQESNINQGSQNLLLPFFTDSKLDFSTRNVWRTLNENESSKDRRHMAWGQGFTLDFQSGYLADLIGVDASYNRVLKLKASDNFVSRGVLYNDTSANTTNKNNAKGFGKVGQLYGKMKFEGQEFKGNLYSGRKNLDKFGAITMSTRAATNSYIGTSGDLTIGDYRARLAYVTRSLNRDSPDVVHFTTSDRKKIDYIVTGDLRYQTDTLTLNYFYGESQNYLRRHGLETRWKVNEQWQLGSEIYGTQALDKWKEMANSTATKRTSKEFDNRAWFYEVTAGLKQGDWFNKVGVAYTDAPKSHGIGQYPRHISRNSRGNFNGMTAVGLDYMRDKETTLSWLLSYTLTPEWEVGVQSNYGTFRYKGDTIQEGEVNPYFMWKPQNNVLKGFSLFARVGPGKSYQHDKRVPLYDGNGNIRTARSLGAEVVANYKINLF
ncbi:MAG: OprD family outer membrane porin [Enterobacteriaceae bacterium]